MASSDPRVADLVRAGALRVALFPPQYSRDQTGALTSPWVEMARALADRIGIGLAVVELSNPDQLAGCLASGGCDIGAMGFDPTRAPLVGGFTAAFMRVDYSFLVPAGSPIRNIADVDRAGLRVAAVLNHASTLALGRMLKHAEQIGTDTPDIAFELLRSGRVDAWASILPALAEYAGKLPGSRLLEGSYGANLPALVVPKGQTARLAFISEFIDEAKASGLVQQAIERAGQPGYRALPANDGVT